MSDEAQAIARRRGKWSQKDVPHLGWICVAEYDAKEDGGDMIICEMCETMEVRFVHVMTNERYPEQLRCGCICAGHMSGELTAAQDRDKRMRSRAHRRANFPKRKAWRTSAQGTPHIEIDGYHLMVARKRDGKFQVGAKGPRDAEHRWGTKRYASLIEAQKGCFDALEYFDEKQAQAVEKAREAFLRSTP
jgi:hypothetical protein